MIELYHFWSSVCSVRCRMALEEKGVKWTSRYIDLFKFDQLEPDYLAINPDGMVPTLVHDGAPVRESIIINEYIDAAFAGPALIPAEPLKQARMREFIRKCEDGFDAIVKLTMVKYILPKLRNRWSDEELLKRAAQRPLRYYQDIHSRAVRGEITPAELAEARATIEQLLSPRTHARSGTLDRRRRADAGRHRHRSIRVPAVGARQRSVLVEGAPATNQRLVRATVGAAVIPDRGVLAGRKRWRLCGSRPAGQIACRRDGGVTVRPTHDGLIFVVTFMLTKVSFSVTRGTSRSRKGRHR
jgi:glutathione S-transferase